MIIQPIVSRLGIPPKKLGEHPNWIYDGPEGFGQLNRFGDIVDESVTHQKQNPSGACTVRTR